MVNNIVVAVDESEESMRACEWACKHLLAAQSYNMTLVHVQPSASSVSSGPAYILGDEVFQLLEFDMKRTTQRILNRALHICERYGVKAETHVVIGGAKEKICEAAAKLGAHLLVVGSHGQTNFIRAIWGSASDYCARNAICPVVVVNRKAF
jgi:nucleotide-binding universal stress UspA family protein